MSCHQLPGIMTKIFCMKWNMFPFFPFFTYYLFCGLPIMDRHLCVWGKQRWVKFRNVRSSDTDVDLPIVSADIFTIFKSNTIASSLQNALFRSNTIASSLKNGLLQRTMTIVNCPLSITISMNFSTIKQEKKLLISSAPMQNYIFKFGDQNIIFYVTQSL